MPDVETETPIILVQQVKKYIRISSLTTAKSPESQPSSTELEVLQSLGRHSGVEALRLSHLAECGSSFVPAYWSLQKQRLILYSIVSFEMEALRKRPQYDDCFLVSEKTQQTTPQVLTIAPKMFVCARSSIKLILLYFKSLSSSDIPEAIEFLDEFLSNLNQIPRGSLRLDRREAQNEFWSYGLDQLRNTLVSTSSRFTVENSTDRMFMSRLLECLLTLAISRQSLLDVLVVCDCLIKASKMGVGTSSRMLALVG
jgi:hypothetical protein